MWYNNTLHTVQRTKIPTPKFFHFNGSLIPCRFFAAHPKFPRIENSFAVQLDCHRLPDTPESTSTFPAFSTDLLQQTHTHGGGVGGTGSTETTEPKHTRDFFFLLDAHTPEMPDENPRGKSSPLGTNRSDTINGRNRTDPGSFSGSQDSVVVVGLPSAPLRGKSVWLSLRSPLSLQHEDATFHHQQQQQCRRRRLPPPRG